MVEGTLALIDGVRGLFFAALLAGIGIAAMVAGGLAGWLLGLALLALCVVVVVLAVRRAREASSSRKSL
jgi:membrane protein implicated in regulation of membrane protease activity